ncbi:GNAT family N-acetyltransferase, partial [archaeon]
TVDNVEVHEFLADYKVCSEPVYRVALGKLIPARERKTFRPVYFAEHDKTGSVGFMDVVIRYWELPKHGSDWSERERVKTLTLLSIGIEPQYRGRGFARFLKQRAEQIAREWDLDVVVGDNIQNPIMIELNRKMGYTLLYNDYTMSNVSYKRLKVVSK